MDDVMKMLRAIMNGQSALKQELLNKIDGVYQKLDGKISKLDNRVGKIETRMDTMEKNLTERIDKLGLSIARLEDDTPTREEFDKLEKRVERVGRKIVSS